jgi:hypothetical protein
MLYLMLSLLDAAAAERVRLNFPPETSLHSLFLYFADARGLDPTLPAPVQEQLKKERVSLLCPREVSPEAAWVAWMSALDLQGWTLTVSGRQATFTRVRAAPREVPVVEVFALEHSVPGDLMSVLDGTGTQILVSPKGEALIVSGSAAAVRDVHVQLEALDGT